MKFVIPLLIAFGLSNPAAASNVFQPYIGVNGVWFDESAQPADYEAGAGLALSLQSVPVLALDSQYFYGFEHNYSRGSFGVKLGTSDPENKDFGAGLSLRYHISSKTDVRPEEWTGGALVGIRPLPKDFPSVYVGAEVMYGLTSKEMQLNAAVRNRFGGPK